jgi:hypothetical protein
MINGQSIVLYSRLNLVTRNQKLIRFVLWLIIVDGTILSVVTITFNAGQFSASLRTPEIFTKWNPVVEKIQLSWFTAQELFISSVYFWEIRKIFETITIRESRTRTFLWQLVAMNATTVLLDITLIVLEGFGFYQIVTTFKSLGYSVKLKVELCVLSQLVSAVTNRDGVRSGGFTTNIFKSRIPARETKSTSLSASAKEKRLETPVKVERNEDDTDMAMTPESCLTNPDKVLRGPNPSERKYCDGPLAWDNDCPLAMENWYPGRLG